MFLISESTSKNQPRVQSAMDLKTIFKRVTKIVKFMSLVAEIHITYNMGR